MSALPNPFDGFVSACDAAPAMAAVSTIAPPSDTAADCRFVLDVERFMLDIEPAPLFLQGPPIHADDLVPMLRVLAGS